MKLFDSKMPLKPKSAKIELSTIEQLASGALFSLSNRLRRELRQRSSDSSMDIEEFIKKYQPAKNSDLTVEINMDDEIDFTVIRPLDKGNWTLDPEYEDDEDELKSIAERELRDEMAELVKGTCFKEQNISASGGGEVLLACSYTAPIDHLLVREHTRIVYLRSQSLFNGKFR